jgi:hypothetical protein
MTIDIQTCVTFQRPARTVDQLILADADRGEQTMYKEDPVLIYSTGDDI